MAKDVNDGKTVELNNVNTEMQYSTDEKRLAAFALRLAIKSHERAIRMHQTQGRTNMAQIYLEEGRLMQNLLTKITGNT